MATEVITLSDLADPRGTQPKPTIQDTSRHSQDYAHTGVTLRTSNDDQTNNTHHDENRSTTPTPNNAHNIDDQSSRLPFNRLMLVYACLATAYATSTLDITAVASALPAIGNSLNAGTTITWAGTAYLMGQAACQPLYGRLSDVFGRKPMLMLSLTFIIIGGILCGFAQTPTWLYVCRALSGVGGGGVSSVVAIVISDLVSMRDRGKYQGLLSAAIGLGSCSGPFIAAEMLRRGGEAWRWIFWMPPILASGCLVCMWFLLPLRPVTGSWREKVGKIDWFGLVVAVVAMVFLLVSIFF
jgi:MFS family permease